MSQSMIHDIPIRVMWQTDERLSLENKRKGVELPGRCGETSLQMSLAWHGCYTSAETTFRAGGGRELLVGTGNDTLAAETMLLRYEVFGGVESAKDRKEMIKGRFVPRVGGATSLLSNSTETLCDFIKRTINDRGVVVMGLMDYEDDMDEYSHIMPIIGYEVNRGVSYAIMQNLFTEDRLHPGIAMSGTRWQLTRKQATPATKPSEDVSYVFSKYIAAIGVQGLVWDGAEGFRRVTVRVPYVNEPAFLPLHGDTIVGPKPVTVTVSSVPGSYEGSYTLLAVRGVLAARSVAAVLLEGRSGRDLLPSKVPKYDPTVVSPDADSVARAEVEVIATGLNGGAPFRMDYNVPWSSDTVYFMCVTSDLFTRKQGELVGLMKPKNAKPEARVVASVNSKPEEEDEEWEEEDEEEEEDISTTK